MKSTLLTWNPISTVPAAIRAIRPSAGPPGTRVSIIGRAPWKVRRACDVTLERDRDSGLNTDTCVGEVVFGSYLCDTGAGSDEESTIISGPHWRLGDEEIDRYPGWNSYNLSCTLPDPSDDGSDSMVSCRGTLSG